MRVFLWIMLLTVSGCTTMDHSSLISPSESLYYKGNQFYEDKDYAAAITQYEAFLEAKPASELATPATLNLGMAHYYSEEYKQAYDVLKDITMKDENIKKYVSEIVEICKTKAKTEIEAEEQAQLAAASPDATASGEIEITVLDAYVDNFGAVVLKGTASQKSTIIIDNKKIDTEDGNNAFHATASWKKGNPIVIAAQGAGGTSGELSYFPDGETPEKPTGLRALNITSTSVEIEWDKNDEEDVKGYRLFYIRQNESLKEIPGLITETKYEVVGLGSLRTYQLYLRAVDKMNNESEDSEILEVTLL